MNDIFIPSLETAQQIANQYGTPTFITDAETLRNRVSQMKNSFSWKNKKVFYAIKANFNPGIVTTLKDAGIAGIDAVSFFEVQLAFKLGFKSHEIIFTGSNVSDEEMKLVQEKNVLQNIGSISELQRFAKMFPEEDVSIRINPGVGAGENEKVITGGDKTKFGINLEDIPKAESIIKKHNLSLAGIHFHLGSGFYDAKVFADAVKIFTGIASNFPNLSFIDFGGGYGARYHINDTQIDLIEFSNQINPLLETLSKKNGRSIEIRFEPGKFLVAESTILLTKITTIKNNGDRKFIGVDTGFNHLIRPSYYDAWHEIINISNPDGKKETVDIAGNLCESGDIFARDREIAAPNEGDLIAILTSGAYCSSMSSMYNLRPFAAEVLVDGGEIKLTRKRLSFDELVEGAGLVFE